MVITKEIAAQLGLTEVQADTINNMFAFVKFKTISELQEASDPFNGYFPIDKGGGELEKIKASVFYQIIGNVAKPISPSDPAPTTIGWYKPQITSNLDKPSDPNSTADYGEKYPNAGNLRAKSGYDTLFYFSGTNWKKTETKFPGDSAKKVFDPTNDNDPATMKATSGRYDKLLEANKGFLNQNTSEPIDKIVLTTSNAVYGGKFLLANGGIFTNVEYPFLGVITDYPVGNSTTLRVKNIFNTQPGNQYAAVLAKKQNGAVTVLLPWTDPFVEGERIYDVSEYSTVSIQVRNDKPFPTIELLTYPKETIDIRQFIEEREVKDTFTYYLEDFGAERLNPNNPDAGKDCTQAFRDCISAIFADENIRYARIILKGMYRLGGEMIQDGNLWSQINFPTIQYSTTMKIKNIAIEGIFQPVWEEQGIIEMPVSYNACGFYSSLYNQPTANRFNCVLNLGRGKVGSTFGEFNNINCWMDNVMVICRSHDESGNPVSNTMSGIFAGNNTNFNFGKICCRTSVPVVKSVEPNSTTVGLFLPKANNHASIVGNYARCMGFGTGLYATEHAQINIFVGVGNVVGIYCQHFYPITINTITLECNKKPILLDKNAYLNAWVYQGERVNDSSKWYANTKDFYQESGLSKVNIGQFIVHNEGGVAVEGLWDPGVSMKIMSDEWGRSFQPLPVWSALPSNPVKGLSGIFNDENYIYVNGWKKSTLTSI
ncbi:hypothetical protein EG359_17490 [Chryseobacterium joostei]|uniref:Uncharacterized protein n=1 Tax=Chryseobacterium joostei TaxID=112234 RepID=A0A1N7IB46_9FLAO|nr:hypothetical protein [Chryseobacterium joostei]AZB01298.1 hypothetical protein EG359_17490 [Chryseobacterium joostei]SIS34316.1 hypothetical protein SAMN05421768_103699 [Chryseobacterium joostei]